MKLFVQLDEVELKILIAEDDQSISNLYSKIFTSRGHKVVLTKDGRECVINYRRENNKYVYSKSLPFDVVILDYAMPAKNGVTTAHEILEMNPEQRIIFISAYPAKTLEEFNDDKRAIEFLNKPFPLPALISTVEKTAKTLKDKIPLFEKWDGMSGTSELPETGAAQSAHKENLI